MAVCWPAAIPRRVYRFSSDHRSFSAVDIAGEYDWICILIYLFIYITFLTALKYLFRKEYIFIQPFSQRRAHIRFCNLLSYYSIFWSNSSDVGVE